jgi:hypothetical protein
MASWSVLCERLGREQELHSEVTYEVRLHIAGGLNAAACHQQQNKGRMDFVAQATFDSLLAVRGIKGP